MTARATAENARPHTLAIIVEAARRMRERKKEQNDEQ